MAEYTDFMSISEKEEFLKQNPNVTQLLTAPIPIGDSVRLGLRKPDNGFRDLLKRVQSHHPLAKGINTF